MIAKINMRSLKIITWLFMEMGLWLNLPGVFDIFTSIFINWFVS